MERFKRDETKCIPACDSYQFHMENLHVSLGFRGSYQLYVFSVFERKCRLPVAVEEPATFGQRYCHAFSQGFTDESVDGLSTD